jgi:hypothetical protein
MLLVEGAQKKILNKITLVPAWAGTEGKQSRHVESPPAAFRGRKQAAYRAALVSRHFGLIPGVYFHPEGTDSNGSNFET